ncbi:hypothetical protein [Portibacter lacus]|uniref:DUF4835 domain-containing protein n=1 Tax=Portibacter lacus TaxID=1099794 RepID=A0AA37SJD8_9BACT|nr:hypothetical protein [Portibacter lacus]GLR15601.1 hypothetical protein GCM10007940_02160 [Portibacter lacus]
MKNTLILLALLFCVNTANTQSSTLEIIPEIRLPKDSIKSEQLITSLNQFLIAAQANARENDWVYPPEYLQTSLLLDEIVGIQNDDDSKNTNTYQPVLIDLSSLSENQYFIQISYVSKADQKLKAIIELIAHKADKSFLFSSPLNRNTKDWNTISIDNYTFHYQGTINVEKSKEYIKQSKFHDANLEIKSKEVTFYLLDDGLRTQPYLGLPFRLGYNGIAGRMSWSVINENQDIYLVHKSYLSEFDPHDLWHARLRQVTPRNKVNHAVDEGIATLYGGSWGFNWKEMFIAFQDQLKFNESTDWLKLKAEKAAFITDGHRNPSDFMINALFVKKIETEKGFSAVMDLLFAKEEEAYLKKLDELTGINMGNYNQEVWKLVKQELEVLKIGEHIN